MSLSPRGEKVVQRNTLDLLRRPTSLPVSPIESLTSTGDNEVNNGDTPAEDGLQGPVKFSITGNSPADSVTSGSDSGIKRGIRLGSLTYKGVSFLMDSSPVLSKSRTERFHKLFKSVPEDEFPIDYFSCAYIGDILLQGNLYVSQNWFCFYSRIRGRGRRLEIPMEDVISITREKTAIIFPNAIGLQTKKEKFAFGSFLTRDSTYKFLVSIWKKSQELKASTSENATDGFKNPSNSSCVSQDLYLSSPEGGEGDDENINNNISSVSHSNSNNMSSDQSDISVCLECGSIDPSDTNELGSRSPESGSRPLSDKTDTNSSPSHVAAAICQNRNHVHRHSSKEKKINHDRRKGLEGKRLQFPYSVMHCIDRHKTIDAFWQSAIKLQKIPRTNLLLAVCTILVMFLLVSAVGLTYKILDLEAKLETQAVWTQPNQHTFKKEIYGSMIGLHSTVQQSTAQHMNTVLEANIKILEEINSNLKNLNEETKSKPPGTCESDDC